LEVDPVASLGDVGLIGCVVTGFSVALGLSDGFSPSFGCWGDLLGFVGVC